MLYFLQEITILTTIYFIVGIQDFTLIMNLSLN